MVEEAAGLLVEGGDRFKVALVELEIEHGEILRHPLPDLGMATMLRWINQRRTT